jgi:hypothetical protein
MCRYCNYISLLLLLLILNLSPTTVLNLPYTEISSIIPVHAWKDGTVLWMYTVQAVKSLTRIIQARRKQGKQQWRKKLRLSQKVGDTQCWHQIISTTSLHRTGSHSNKHTTITKRKQCHKQPKTVVRNLRPRKKHKTGIGLQLHSRKTRWQWMFPCMLVGVCLRVCVSVCAGWCLQVELSPVLELESRPGLKAAWHRRWAWPLARHAAYQAAWA